MLDLINAVLPAIHGVFSRGAASFVTGPEVAPEAQPEAQPEVGRRPCDLHRPEEVNGHPCHPPASEKRPGRPLPV